MQWTTTTTTKTLLSGALGMILTGSLLGDVTTAHYSNGSHYSYHLSQMPDFDQSRETLPSSETNVPGGMYCVPASCTNLLAYMSSHGVTGVGPVFADWESGDNYNGITNFIRNLGNDMGTSGTDGTMQSDAYSAMVDRVVFPSGFRYIVGYEIRNRNNLVTLRELSRSGIFQEAIQTVGYGRYDSLGFHGTSRVINRKGGHRMTFTGGERSGTYRHMWANDSGGDNTGSWSNQSTFVRHHWDTPWNSKLRVASSLSSAGSSPVQGMNRLMRGSADEFIFIDNRLIIQPYGYSSWGEWEGNGCSVGYQGWSMYENAFAHSPLGRVPFEPASILKVPFGDDFVIQRLEDGRARIWRPSAETNEFAPVFFGDVEGPDFLDFAISKDLGILALSTNGALYELPNDPEIEITPETMRIVLDGLHGYDRVSTDPDTGMISLIDTREGFMKLADRYLEDVRTFDIRFIPAVSDQFPQVFGDFDQDGRSDMIVVGRDFNQRQSVNLLSFQGQQVDIKDITDQLIEPGSNQVPQIRGLATDDSGALLLNLEGTIHAYDCQGQGEFLRNPEHGLAGQLAGHGLAISRSFTNYDPRIHDTEGWNTQLDESETCPDDDCGITGDLNGDNVVDGQDLATLLAAWDSDSEIADLDGDGRVSGPDLAILLGAYGS